MSDPFDMDASGVGGVDDLGAVAREQFGLVSREQALARDLGTRGIRWKLDSGDWEPFLRGVYRLRGTTRTWSQLAMGSLPLGGEGSALSHGTAAFLHDLDGFKKTRPELVDVTAAAQCIATGVRFHRTRDEHVPTEKVRGLIATSLPRTLVDLAAILKRKPLEIALDSARRGNPKLPDELATYLATLGSHRRHLSVLKELLAARASPLDSAKEVELSQEIGRRDLPPPIAGHSVYVDRKYIMKVDFAWLEALVALHFDSYYYHHHRERFERDARQRSRLAAAGWTNIIVTSQSLHSPDWSNAVKKHLAMTKP